MCEAVVSLPISTSFKQLDQISLGLGFNHFMKPESNIKSAYKILIPSHPLLNLFKFNFRQCKFLKSFLKAELGDSETVGLNRKS